MAAPSFIERFYELFPLVAFKFEMLSTTLYQCAVLFQSWNYKEWNLIFCFLSMCKLRRITHKFNIKAFDKNQKIKFHSYNKSLSLTIGYIGAMR